jgi:hypothetical protein
MDGRRSVDLSQFENTQGALTNQIIRTMSQLPPLLAEEVLRRCMMALREQRYFARECAPQRWMPVVRPGYEKYVVSEFGYVRIESKSPDKRLEPMFRDEYARVGLSRPKTSPQLHMVHELVFEAFVLGSPIPKEVSKSRVEVINHINGDKWDPSLANLELTTQGKNLLHAYSTGLR